MRTRALKDAALSPAVIGFSVHLLAQITILGIFSQKIKSRVGRVKCPNEISSVISTKEVPGMRTKLQTVKDPVEVESLGLVLPHEHLFTDLRGSQVPGYAQGEPARMVFRKIEVIHGAGPGVYSCIVETRADRRTSAAHHLGKPSQGFRSLEAKYASVFGSRNMRLQACDQANPFSNESRT
jgi:hypothetical protein